MMRKWLCLVAITGGCLLALSAPSTAQKGKKEVKEFTEEEKSALQQVRMQRLILAQDLAAEGRNTNSPELLISAASILRSLSKIPEMNKPKVSDVKPEIKGEGDAELDKVITPLTLEEQSDQLFSDATTCALDQGVNVKLLIEHIKNREQKGDRSPVGGPKQVGRKIAGGQTHSFNFKLVNHAPTYWAFQSSIPLHISVVRNDDNNAWFLNTTMHAARTFHPAFLAKTVKVAPITIRVKNPTKVAATYQFVLQ